MLSISELKSSTLSELLKELQASMTKLQELRIGVKTSHLKDTSAIKKQKQYVARILTLVKEIELDDLVKKAIELPVN